MEPSQSYQREFEEVSIPRAQGRHVMEIDDDVRPASAVHAARTRLEEFRSRYRVKFAFRSWARGKRLSLLATSGKINLLNRSRMDTDQCMTSLLCLHRALELKQRVRVFLHDSWLEIDRTSGGSIAGPILRNPALEAETWRTTRGGLIQLCVPTKTIFPCVWKPSLSKYLQRATWFQDADEVLFYFAAYEMRRCWQFECPGKAEKVFDLMDINPFVDAELYAIRSLSYHRAIPPAT